MNERPGTVGEATRPTGAASPSATRARSIETGSIETRGTAVGVGRADGADDAEPGLDGTDERRPSDGLEVGLEVGAVDPHPVNRTTSTEASDRWRRASRPPH